MRRGTILFGTIGVAMVVFGVGMALSRVHPPERWVHAVETLGKDPRPQPPLADLPRNLATMSDVEAAAFLYIDDHLFTRFDSARAAHHLPCDEGMPDELLFAADGKILDVKQERSSVNARVELVSIGNAKVVWDGCTLVDAQVEQTVRTDTVSLTLERDNGRWRVSFDEVVRDDEHLPLAGPLNGIANADWQALGARADSVRVAHGRQPARMRTVSGKTHLVQDPGSYLRYPELFDIPCTAAQPAPPASDFAQLEFIDAEYSPNFTASSGTWWTIYEPRDSAGRSCITPLQLKFVQSFPYQCGSSDKRAASVYAADSFASRPLLLVRGVNGLRTSQQRDRFTIMAVPGWDKGVLVYSDSGELFRVTETPDGDGGGHYLTVDYQGKSHPLKHGEPNESWGIYWVGQLNADTIPDFVLRVTTQGTDVARHTLVPFLSTPERGDASLWMPQRGAFVQICK